MRCSSAEASKGISSPKDKDAVEKKQSQSYELSLGTYGIDLSHGVGYLSPKPSY